MFEYNYWDIYTEMHGQQNVKKKTGIHHTFNVMYS